jgi:NAD(P)H-hydrate epimerase
MRLQAVLDPLMTVAEMTAADTAAPSFGMPSMTLMEHAGRAVADEIGKRFTPRPTAILCGPGNNGGDGYVAARTLRQRGWPVTCHALGDPSALRGDAAAAFGLWLGETLPLSEDLPQAELLVDALFGAGLSRPLTGAAAALAQFSSAVRDRIVAIDVPSGLQGDTGCPLGGVAVHAGLTVTFVRRKPGHCLSPGRYVCGEVATAGIGMPDGALPAVSRLHALTGLAAREGDPAAHKYDRGHCLVISGPAETTGAARLAARGAERSGAGLTTVAAGPAAARIHAAHLTSIMVRVFEAPDGLAELLADRRRNAIVIGPGLGLTSAASALLDLALAAGRACVLDADALTLVGKRQSWPLPSGMILTPHGGEFARLFPDIAEALPQTGRLAAARTAARRAGCVVLLKGPDTVIAAPDGAAVIDTTAPPSLAIAGSGDVLSGLIGGMLVQGYAPFEAAVTGVALHAAAARAFGPGLVAEDLPGAVPAVLAGLAER